MSKFIQLTSTNGSIICVNFAQVIYLEKEVGSTFISTTDMSIWVKDSYEDIISLLQNVTRKIQ